MKRPSRKAKRRRDAVRVWTQDQATALVPYLKSVVDSLREHTLQAQQSRREARKLEEKPGRLRRDEIIARLKLDIAEAQGALERADAEAENKRKEASAA